MAPRSNIWMFFTKGILSGQCNECGATIKTMGNTMNMWNHLQRRHPKEYASVRGNSFVEEATTDHDPLAAEEEVLEPTGTVLEDGSFQIDIDTGTQQVVETTSSTMDDDLSEFLVPKEERKRERVKVVIEWTCDAIMRLISAVHKRPLLWNSEHPDHVSKILRETAWQGIAQDEFEDQYDADQLIAKWNNLRIQFKAYWSKTKRSKARHDSGQKKVIWRYFRPMAFLAASSDSSLLKAVTEQTEDVKHRPRPTPTRTSMASAQKRRLSPEKSVAKFSSPPGNHLSQDVYEEKRSVQKVEKIDSFQVFGNFVAEELRKIPDQVLANQVQRKLTRYLMDCMDEVDEAYCHQSLNN
ncbi:uncharacterized protein LOC131440029 isoform X2 [Malaya genurostris]|uniref:uncharacterized protein LOC131440029 isoform X2 n=1 Tax=Malaya genurostris TaxID=325434 RepID=UPI0026F3B081|nr:uncharacterized protein LOC131440029 isoform X2 [Malaya genurostris]